MVVPPTPKPTCKAEALAKAPPTIASSCEENAALKKWHLPRLLVVYYESIKREPTVMLLGLFAIFFLFFPTFPRRVDGTFKKIALAHGGHKTSFKTYSFRDPRICCLKKKLSYLKKQLKRHVLTGQSFKERAFSQQISETKCFQTCTAVFFAPLYDAFQRTTPTWNVSRISRTLYKRPDPHLRPNQKTRNAWEGRVGDVGLEPYRDAGVLSGAAAGKRGGTLYKCVNCKHYGVSIQVHGAVDVGGGVGDLHIPEQLRLVLHHQPLLRRRPQWKLDVV
jgi:hypothetical protein